MKTGQHSRNCLRIFITFLSQDKNWTSAYFWCQGLLDICPILSALFCLPKAPKIC